MKNFLGLGLGLDLHIGADLNPLKQFAQQSGGQFQYAFASLQANSHDLLWMRESQEKVIKKLDDFFSLFPHLHGKFALHHTMLNMAGNLDDYPKDEIVNFTNRLTRLFKFRWINEDLGIWFLKGKKTPYPFPPFLTHKSLDLCVKNIKWYQDHLEAPLLVEYPGYSEGSSFPIGPLNQIDFFSEVIKKANAFWTLDTGHVLGSVYSTSKKLEVEIERLPLSLCREIHLSGSAIINNEFLDLHHGVLIPEQLELLRLLRHKVPNLFGVCYEDPKFTPNGELIPKALPLFTELSKEIKIWKQNSMNFCTTAV
jgi:uncharacterized protein (UPF0276 family)